ncbi:MAG: hypothetical protein R3E50_13665 [Halioglobus sp.]
MALASHPLNTNSIASGFEFIPVGAWDEYKRIRQGDTSEPKSVASQPAGPLPEGNAIPKAKPKPPPLARQQKPVAAGEAAPEQVTAPREPTEVCDWWAFYSGKMNVHANPYYDPHGIDFKWAYSRKNPLPRDPRIVFHMHGSGGGEGSMEVFGPSPKGHIEVRNQDAETYNQDWREWWTFGRNGTR